MSDTLVARIEDDTYILEFWDTNDASLCPACPACMRILSTWFTINDKTYVECCGAEREAI
tara:strand:+ start:95 stop:274 length:180 start_codon:yes stop_codon:yes gene_type:complete